MKLSRAEKIILGLAALTVFCSGLIFGDGPKHKKLVLKIFPSIPWWIHDRELPPPKLHLIRTKSEMPCGQTSIVLEFEYLGTYFITGYSDEEAYCRITASGEEVHFSEEWDEPTTCAIDRNYHSFGDILLVGDPYDPDNRKLYIAEDTGSAVKGHHVDCFVETMEEVNNFPTRYESVYLVTYIDLSMTEEERQAIYDSIDNYLHHRSAGGRVPDRDDPGTGY